MSRDTLELVVQTLSQSILLGFGLVTSLAMIGHVVRWFCSFINNK